jgi:prophage antirepressor-like protein
MDILKAFSIFDDEEHHINIQGTPENPLFQANQIGKLLGISNIRENLRDYDSKHKVVCLTDTVTRGVQQTVFLTELGLYKILGRSRKPIANVFQNWIVEVIKEIRINGIYQLKKENEIEKHLFKNKMLMTMSNTLKESHHNKNLVYICKMKDDEENPNNFIIKIGSTQNIKERLGNISRDYNIMEPLLLDVFQFDDYTKLENMIHKNEVFQNYRYDKIIKRNGHISRETYLVNEELYNNLIVIIKEIKSKIPIQNIDKSIELEKLSIEKEKLIVEKENARKDAEIAILRQKEIELKQREIDFEIQKLQHSKNEFIETSVISSAKEEPSSDDEEEVRPKNHIQYVISRNNSQTIPKVCQYDPTNLQTPVRIYDSPIEVERLHDFISQPSMRIAASKNTIYKGYRWFYIKRDQEPPEEIPPTVENKCKSTEVRFIAMIDVKKTKILDVFATQKEATEARNMKCNNFSRAIKEQTLSSGHYWNYYDACPIEWREEYLKTKKLPEKHVYQNGKVIQQIDPITMKVIETFQTKRDVVRKFQVSYNKLGSVVNTDEMYSGYFWKELIPPTAIATV